MTTQPYIVPDDYWRPKKTLVLDELVSLEVVVRGVDVHERGEDAVVSDRQAVSAVEDAVAAEDRVGADLQFRVVGGDQPNIRPGSNALAEDDLPTLSHADVGGAAERDVIADREIGQTSPVAQQDVD